MLVVHCQVTALATLFLLVQSGLCGFPSPSVLTSVSLSSSGAPRCPVTVVSTTSIFTCVRNTAMNQSHALAINPIAKTFGTPSPLGNGTSFVFPPIAVSTTTAIVFANYPDSFYTLVSSVDDTSNSFFQTRGGTPTGVAYAEDEKIAFVPFGFDKRALYDGFNAYAITPANSATNSGPSQTQLWNKRYQLPADYPWTTQVTTPIYYRGALYVLVNNTFYAYDAQTGQVNQALDNPCGMNIAPSSELQLYQVSYGADENGSLDAFLIFANTTTSDAPGFALCRVSHTMFGQSKWIFSLEYDATVQDVSGATGTILLTVHVPSIDSANSLVTIAINAETGDFPGGYVNRDVQQDMFNLPVLLPNPVPGCGASVALQVQGVLQAVCTSDMTTAVWVAAIPCFYKAAADPITGDIVCIDRFKTVTRVNATDGTVVWQATVEGEYAATIQGDYAWVIDQSATLWGLSMQLQTQEAAPDDGFTGGEVVLVIFVAVFVGALVAAIGFAYLQRKRRARPTSYSQVDSTNFAGYGSDK